METMTGSAALILMALAAQQAAGGDGRAAPSLGDLRSAVFLRGTCDRLLVAGTDRSSFCHTALVNLSYHQGRTSFAFADHPAGMMISFSGMGEPAGSDRGRLTLDMVTRASNGGETLESEPIEGSCEYTNPHAGRATIRCEGVAASGAFSGVFTSDGEPPHVVEIPPPQ